ncbi:hypothetical protein [Oryza sativa Japonica Group]|uniref:Uncharacterized protein n=1 Tax=Oryza sativa subsp. japonica TaxID=39947 RepID=Q5ZCH2_ORYSJ|nr:hypothetical protein [Oryza sativa Japonica Group]BAD68639.1 hypothetical protein [Oryza sativa Japonica Group]
MALWQSPPVRAGASLSITSLVRVHRRTTYSSRRLKVDADAEDVDLTTKEERGPIGVGNGRAASATGGTASVAAPTVAAASASPSLGVALLTSPLRWPPRLHTAADSLTSLGPHLPTTTMSSVAGSDRSSHRVFGEPSPTKHTGGYALTCGRTKVRRGYQEYPLTVADGYIRHKDQPQQLTLLEQF